MAIDIRGLVPLFQVFDMPTSINFYCDKLGFEIAASDGRPWPNFDWVLLRLNETEIMLNTAYERQDRPSVPDSARIAAHEDVTLYFGCPDVDGAYAYLRSVGINAKGPKVAPYGMKQLYLSDPDGYLLCWQCRVNG